MSDDNDHSDDLDSQPSSDDIKETLEKITARCDAAKFSYEDDSTLDDEVDISLTVHIPCGRETRSVYLFDFDELLTFQSIEFEKYTLLGSYAAVCSYEDGVIEAVLSSPSISKSPFQRRRILKQLGLTTSQTKQETELTLSSPLGVDGVQIKLRRESKAAQILSQASDPLSVSLELTCPKLSSHDDALAILNQVSNALFFEIDLQKGIHLSLLRKTQRPRLLGAVESELPIAYPKNVYDEAPMALYWYARSATNMPLLQFLAYYQTIEYYYPVFYNAEISRRIRSIIKNPTFRADRESDISKIVSTIRSKGIGIVSEKDQLRTTLRECIQNEDIEEFLTSGPKRAEFFISKAKGITSHVLNPQNKGHDLCSQASDRIYDIRCKIVHTKGDEGDGEIELLLPYSKEADKLGHDIELVRLIAQKVLIYASKELHGLA